MESIKPVSTLPFRNEIIPGVNLTSACLVETVVCPTSSNFASRDSSVRMEKSAPDLCEDLFSSLWGLDACLVKSTTRGGINSEDKRIQSGGLMGKLFNYFPSSWKPLICGSALFSMFFGAGNVIFSLWTGYRAGPGFFWPSFLGFFASAILIPLVTLFSVTMAGQQTEDFFSPFAVIKGLRSVLITLLLWVWAPLGSIPRAIELAYTSLEEIWPARPWGFTHLLVALAMVGMASSPGGVVQMLGRFLTPALLLLIAALVASFFSDLFFLEKVHPYMDHAVEKSAQATAVESLSSGEPTFFLALKEGAFMGYQTMDGIAALFFAVFFIQLFMQEQRGVVLRENPLEERQQATCQENLEESRSFSFYRDLLWTFFFAAVIEALCYAALVYVSSHMRDEVIMQSPAALLQQIARRLLGPGGGWVSSWIVLLAAIPTAVTLVVITQEHLHSSIKAVASKHHGFLSLLAGERGLLRSAFSARVVIMAISFGMSLLRIEGIRNFSQPILEWAYPLILFLGIYHLALSLFVTRSTTFGEQIATRGGK